MFTGIVEEIGTVSRISKGSASVMLTIAASQVLEGVKSGDSISTNGICLTVTGFDAGSFNVDAMPETMRTTNLGSLLNGSRVNLERAMRLSDRLGGHLLSGHIDGTGVISRIWSEDNAVRMNIQAGRDILRYVIRRGSVGIDGVSLTVASVDESSFGISIIPHTRMVTTLTLKKAGDSVNIECDMIAKYVEKFTRQAPEKGDLNIGFLSKHGYL